MTVWKAGFPAPRHQPVVDSAEPLVERRWHCGPPLVIFALREQNQVMMNEELMRGEWRMKPQEKLDG
jgi:hypothetical protein